LASGSKDNTVKLWDLDKALHPKPKAKPAPQKPKPAPQPKPQQPHVSASTPTHQRVDVALPDGTHIQLEAGLSAQTPIAAVKGMVSAKTGLDYASLCLVFNGLKLEDTRNLASYKIHNGTQLHAVVVTRADADEAGANPQQGGVAKEDTTTKTQELHAQHHDNIATARRKLLGCGFKDVRATRVLGTGCNGAVLEAKARDFPLALKIMYNYGTNTTLVGNLQATEYRFLQRVPEHFNIAAVLGVIPASPLVEDLVKHLPEAAREAAVKPSIKKKLSNRRKKFRSTTGLLLELLPQTLEKYVKDLGDTLGIKEARSLGKQIVVAVRHLETNGVIHGDLKLNNIMVDPGTTPVRIVLVDFGCAVLRGDGAADMDKSMHVHVREGTNFSLGNQCHQAPEVLEGFNRKSKLERDSLEKVKIPLRGQGAFAVGVVLYELAMGLEHPVDDYPVMNSEEAFDEIDFDSLEEEAGRVYTNVVRGLLKYKLADRMTLAAALDVFSGCQ
jgi:hypothetical protein